MSTEVELTLKLKDNIPSTFRCVKLNVYSGYMTFKIKGSESITGIPMHTIEKWSYKYITKE